jgi:hypothetical protein
MLDSYAQVAASVRENKQRHPDCYCSISYCLYRIRGNTGSLKPGCTHGRCPNHPYRPAVPKPTFQNQVRVVRK